jgi:uncharacterized membrane protein YbhN (UPF0104 family)
MNFRRPNPRAISLPDLKSRIDWENAGRWFTVLLLAAAAFMVASYARSIDWHSVWNALRSYSKQEILVAAALTVGSFAVYSSFDLYGRYYTGHALSAPRVMLITAISYAFNLTLGSLVGAAGIRLRLYRQIGVKGADVARIIAISVGVNWLGYAAVAGVLFAANVVHLPASWGVRSGTLPVIGCGLLAIVFCYLVATAFYGNANLSLRGRQLSLPSISGALSQLIIGSANWMIMGGVLYFLMQERASYSMTLAVILVASVAGIISRIPGGIGVLEAVSIAILGPLLGETKALVGVLAYRTIYYLVPLVVASVGLLALEARRRRVSTQT